MAINEIFPNPTVKQVIFQIRFPTLFSMESLIGDYQLKIMDKFPKSQLISKHGFLFAEAPSLEKIEDIAKRQESSVKQVWKFETENGVVLNVQIDSLDISSNVHKTYNNQKSKERFRDIIVYAIGSFLEVTQIPKINRLGLRYIDECPIPSKENVASLLSH